MSFLSAFLFLFCAAGFQNEKIFYQTAFLVEAPSSEMTWRSLGFGKDLLDDSVSALTGSLFSSRPEEWQHYFDGPEFEDEDIQCLNDPSSWYLVAGRVVAVADVNHSFPHLRLTFQPRCGSMFSDTALQVNIESRSVGFQKDLYTFVHAVATSKRRATPFEAVGFASVSAHKAFYDMPAVVRPSNHGVLKQKILRLASSRFHVSSVQWMASLAGKLDWVFGKLRKRAVAGRLRPVPLSVYDGRRNTLVHLGFYDFLPLVLRNAYLQLDGYKKNVLDGFHVTEDLHNSLAAAQEALRTDLKVSDPSRTRHDQVTCIQCHSAQERMERARTFIKHGGTKDFGYFFRGLGYIENSPYVSWRSVQESRVFHERLKAYFKEKS